MSSARRFGGQSMVAPLQRVMVCPPRRAGWASPDRVGRWRELHYSHEPDYRLAQAQHDLMRRELEAASVETLHLGEAYAFSLDAIYCHDASLATDHGAVVLRMGKPARDAEPQCHAEFYRANDIPILGEIREPGTAEAGDMVWLDANTLLVGRGYRTNASGVEQLRALLTPIGVEVLTAPLPHGAGPAACLHLMSLVSLLDEKTAVADPSLLAVETLELLAARGYSLVELDLFERATMACNVLSLGNKKLLALEENFKTNARLRQAGFDVRTFPGSALAQNGGGGPTCLTRPLLRAACS